MGIRDIHPQTIGYIERGQFNSTIELALKLSKVLGVGLDAIFSTQPFGLLDDKSLGRDLAQSHSQGLGSDRKTSPQS